MINDVVVADDDQAKRSESDWIKIIDPILNQV